ncbi:MAG: hypothetical protein ACJAQ1_001730 [Flavobacterium sp.]|jgi:hypothetical protein
MQIQVNTDNHVEGSARLSSYITDEIKTSLSRFDDKITRIEVHLKDENGDKFGLNDKKCLIEIRVANLQPMVVTDHSDTLEKAYHLAIAKAKKVLTTTFEKLKEH